MPDSSPSPPAVPPSVSPQSPVSRVSFMARASMILGLLPLLAIAGILLCSQVFPLNTKSPFRWFNEYLLIVLFALVLLPPIPALILGITGLKRIKKSNRLLSGRAHALAGIVTSLVWIILLVLFVFLIPYLGTLRPQRRNSCQNNLKQFGIIYMMYANESRGNYYPMLSSRPGLLIFQAEPVWPEYLTDSLIMRCPEDPSWKALLKAQGIDSSRAIYSQDPAEAQRLIDDASYIYLGYVITSDDEFEAFAEVYKARVTQGLPFDMDLPAPPGRGSMGTDTFYRLREGVERFFVTDINDPIASARTQSAIPVMWDTVLGGLKGPLSNHQPPGANLLYLDGHVEFVRYPVKWPMTERSIQILTELYSMKLEAPQAPD